MGLDRPRVGAPIFWEQLYAREAAAAVAMMQRPPQRRRNRPRPGSHLHDTAVLIVAHHHAARVARQAPRRFRGNAHAPLEDRLARLIRVRQCRRVHVHHHLIPLTRRAGIEFVMQRRLREQGQRVRLLPTGNPVEPNLQAMRKELRDSEKYSLPSPAWLLSPASRPR